MRYGFTVISSIIVYLTTWLFFGLGDTSQQVGRNNTEEFRNIMLIGIGIGLAATVGFHLIIREDASSNTDVSTVENVVKREKPGLLQWLMTPNLYLVACVYMATRLFVNLTQAYVPFYLQDSIIVSPTYLAIIPLVQFTSSFLSSFLTSLANKRAGRHLTWLLGSSLGLLTAVLIESLPDQEMRQFGIFMVAILIGGSSCVLLITSLGLTADLIGEEKESSALVYGLMSLTDKVSNGLAVLVIQQQLPCLRLYTPDFIQLVPTPTPPCDSCQTQRPTALPSTISPDLSSPCFTFYKTVLTYTTSTTCLAGALGVLVLYWIRFLNRNKNKS